MKWTPDSHRGFTLVEILIAMLIFIIILVIASGGMINILRYGIITMRSETSNIEGIVGVEVLRHDLQQAGLGLFNDELAVPAYLELVQKRHSSNDCNTGSYDSQYKIPRHIVTANDVPGSGLELSPDYLAIKGVSLGNSPTAQKNSFVDDTGTVELYGINDFTSGDKVIVLNSKFDKNKNRVIRTLLNSGASYYTGFNTPLDASYIPPSNNFFQVFGVDNSAVLRAPFNRVDYFLRRDANTPTSCSPAAGTLYRGIMRHSDGSLIETPVLDCVADMQIILGINTTASPETDSSVQFFVPASFSTDGIPSADSAISLTEISDLWKTPQELRKRLRMVIVFLLVQDGQKDSNFVNTNSTFIVGSDQDPRLNRPQLQKIVNLTQANYRNYRWKLYRVAAKIKNQ